MSSPKAAQRAQWVQGAGHWHCFGQQQDCHFCPTKQGMVDECGLVCGDDDGGDQAGMLRARRHIAGSRCREKAQIRARPWMERYEFS
jgi:hypothetical protein